MAVTVEEAASSSYCYELMLKGDNGASCASIDSQNQQEEQIENPDKGSNIDVEA